MGLPNLFRRAAFALLLAAGCPASAQSLPGGPPPGSPPALPPGTTRESMWPAPTAEDWKKPVLIKWQRTYADAQAVAKETGRPMLVCINMDGEIASEHYAGIRYRSPEIAKVYEPYVCVIASVYRHNPRDYDDDGKRIECPRFGQVTCGEHIAIEPLLYDKHEDGRRIAPRHIGVDLDGKEMYDVFYAWDTDSVFGAIRNGVANRPPPPPLVRGDRTLAEKVASHDAEDRVAVEAAYQQGDAAKRRSLLEAAIAAGDAASPDLLRLAVMGFDPELGRLARTALAKSDSVDRVELIAESLRVPMEAPEREALVGALARLGENSPRAKTLSIVHRGLATRSDAVDVEKWSSALETAEADGRIPLARSAFAFSAARAASVPPAVEPDPAATDARIDARHRTIESTDAKAHVELAEAYLACALRPKTDDAFARFLFGEARRVAVRAEALGAPGARTSAAIAVAAYYLGASEEAHERAEKGVAALPANPQSWNSMILLSLFAENRKAAIEKALAEKKDWSGQLLADVHAAYSVLGRHPFVTESLVTAHYDFLRSLGAAGQASRVLDAALERFPESGVLHNRLRTRILAEKGLDKLEPEYERMLAEQGNPPHLEWFAGYAAMLTAEYQRRSGARDRAVAAYERSIAHFDRAIAGNPECAPTADQCAAMALAGRSRIAFEKKDYAKSLDDLVAAFERKPSAAAELDGLNVSAADTSRLLLARLREQKLADLVTRLETALSRLDPALLALPAYEREGPPPPARRGRRN